MLSVSKCSDAPSSSSTHTRRHANCSRRGLRITHTAHTWSWLTCKHVCPHSPTSPLANCNLRHPLSGRSWTGYSSSRTTALIGASTDVLCSRPSCPKPLPATSPCSCRPHAIYCGRCSSPLPISPPTSSCASPVPLFPFVYASSNGRGYLVPSRRRFSGSSTGWT